MRKLIVLIMTSVCALMISCSPANRTFYPEVMFYIDGEEITDNSVEVALNSYCEIQIKTAAPDASSPNGVRYYWQYATGYPVELTNGSDNLALNGTTFGDYLPEYNASGMIQYATFRMQFSDTAYHSGDECYLRVYVQNYEKALKVVVQ